MIPLIYCERTASKLCFLWSPYFTISKSKKGGNPGVNRNYPGLGRCRAKQIAPHGRRRPVKQFRPNTGIDSEPLICDSIIRNRGSGYD